MTRRTIEQPRDEPKPVPARTFRPSARHTREVAAALARAWPDSRCALDYADLYQLIVATILSAQCTDKRVNLVTPRLFEIWPDAASLAAADPAELETVIHSTGFYKAKAKNLIAMARGLVEHHGGQVPESIEDLTRLAGVGRKTANVVLGVGRGIPSGIVVDTHVTRLSNRLGLTKRKDAVGIERDLVKSVPKPDWVLVSLRMIDHGRAICKAGRPRCDHCPLEPLCPKIGVEPGPAKRTKTSAAKPAGTPAGQSAQRLTMPRPAKSPKPPRSPKPANPPNRKSARSNSN